MVGLVSHGQAVAIFDFAVSGEGAYGFVARAFLA